jgi:hypothetical protein
MKTSFFRPGGDWWEIPAVMVGINVLENFFNSSE